LKYVFTEPDYDTNNIMVQKEDNTNVYHVGTRCNTVTRKASENNCMPFLLNSQKREHLFTF